MSTSHRPVLALLMALPPPQRKAPASGPVAGSGGIGGPAGHRRDVYAPVLGPIRERVAVRTSMGHLIRQLLLLSALTVTLHVAMFQAFWYNFGDVVPMRYLLGFDGRWFFLWVFTVGIGLVATGTTSDRLFPLLLGWVGLLLLVFSYEDSILNWIAIGVGVGLRGDRVNPIQIAAFVASLALVAILHMNQLSLGFRQDLQGRGIPKEELRGLEDRTTVAAGRIAFMAGIAVVAGAILLNIFEIGLGQARIGIGGLGIAVGLVAAGAIAWVSYLLLKGPREEDEEAERLAARFFKE